LSYEAGSDGIAATPLNLDAVLDILRSDAGQSRLPEQLENTVFTCLRLRNGVAKTTYAHRLDDLNEFVSRSLPPGRPLRILDVGISSGVSTLEWIHSLEESGFQCHVTAVDLLLTARLITFPARMRVICEYGRPLLMEWRGRLIPYPPGKRNLVRYFPLLLAMRTAVFFAIRKLHAASPGGTQSGWFTSEAIPLVYCELRKRDNVVLVEADVRDRLPVDGPFDVIRAANILNRGYFDDRLLRRMVSNLSDKLAEGGFLVICRTSVHGQNNATIFRRRGRDLEIFTRLNQGSELEPIMQCSTSASSLAI
jgi:hypothetical protein